VGTPCCALEALNSNKLNIQMWLPVVLLWGHRVQVNNESSFCCCSVAAVSVNSADFVWLCACSTCMAERAAGMPALLSWALRCTC